MSADRIYGPDYRRQKAGCLRTNEVRGVGLLRHRFRADPTVALDNSWAADPLFTHDVWVSEAMHNRARGGHSPLWGDRNAPLYMLDGKT